MLYVIVLLVLGLAFFLFSIRKLSTTLQQTLNDYAKKWIQRFISNTLKSIFTGIILSVILHSSSAVIIITIIFVNANILNLRQSMGIVLGSNIGTTASSQLFAFDISKFSPIILVIGVILYISSNNQKVKDIAKIIFYFGLLFFGLYIISYSVEPLKNNTYTLHLLEKAAKPNLGILIGALVTAVIQSSSATVGLAIILAKKGMLSLSAAIAIMMGAELGTCADTLLATIKSNRLAIKTGLFHLFFNLISILLGYIFFQSFVNLIENIGKHLSIERSVANAHMIFNIFGVLLFCWQLPFIEKILHKMLPEKN